LVELRRGLHGRRGRFQRADPAFERQHDNRLDQHRGGGQLHHGTYAASPSANTEALSINLGALPAELGTPISVLFIVEEETSSATGSPLTLTLTESNGSTQIASETIPASTAIGWEANAATLTAGAFSNAQLQNAQLQIALTSTANGTANVYEAQVYVAYEIAYTPTPIGGLVGAGMLPYGLTRAMRQNRVEGYRFQYRNG
jgi:hypothetical protein